MLHIDTNRKDFIKDAGDSAVAFTWATSIGSAANAQAPAAAFDIATTFTGFMKDIGGTPADGGGKVSFNGEDPILRSHFRIGAAMALPAMRANLGAPSIRRAQ